MVYGVWCMVYGVWCMVYGVWCMVHGVWGMVYGVWCILVLYLIEWLTALRGGTVERYYAHYWYTTIAEVASRPTVHRTEM
jgi:hypothetical protein